MAASHMPPNSKLEFSLVTFIWDFNYLDTALDISAKLAKELYNNGSQEKLGTKKNLEKGFMSM